jgi:hypothetical protein
MASWREAPDTLTFESYLAQSGLVELANRRVDLEAIFSNADSIETPLDRHERFRNLAWAWLKERISQGHRSPADEELYQWYFRGEPMSRSALATNEKIWGDGAFRRKLIALRQGCATDGETRHRFEVAPPFGNPALVKTVARVFEGSKPDWQLDLDQLEFRDILRIREDKAFALALHRISLPLPKLAKEPDLERFLRTEWKEALLGAAKPLDRRREVIKKVTEAAGKQAVAGATTVGNCCQASRLMGLGSRWQMGITEVTGSLSLLMMPIIRSAQKQSSGGPSGTDSQMASGGLGVSIPRAACRSAMASPWARQIAAMARSNTSTRIRAQDASRAGRWIWA